MTPQSFNVPLFGDVITFCDDRDAWNAHRAQLNPDSEPLTPCAGATSRMEYPASGVAELVLGVFDGQPATLVHEATHAALFILQRHGMSPESDSGEAMAMLVEAIYSQIMQP